MLGCIYRVEKPPSAVVDAGERPKDTQHQRTAKESSSLDQSLVADTLDGAAMLLSAEGHRQLASGSRLPDRLHVPVRGIPPVATYEVGVVLRALLMLAVWAEGRGAVVDHEAALARVRFLARRPLVLTVAGFVALRWLPTVVWVLYRIVRALVVA